MQELKNFENLKGSHCGENVVSREKRSMNCGRRAGQSQAEQGRGHKPGAAVLIQTSVWQMYSVCTVLFFFSSYSY